MLNGFKPSSVVDVSVPLDKSLTLGGVQSRMRGLLLQDKRRRLKVVSAGNVVEYRSYSVNGVPAGGKTGKRNKSSIRTSRSTLRARRMVSWLSASNAVGDVPPLFFTATFADDVKDYDEAIKRWDVFRRNIRDTFPDLRYVCVPEVQPRSGRWHFHAIFWGCGSEDELRIRFGKRLNKKGKQCDAWYFVFTSIWSQCNGGQRVHRVKTEFARCVGGVAGYCAKYIQKNMDATVPSGRRSYYASKNLTKPLVTVYNDEQASLTIEDLLKGEWFITYGTGQVGERRFFARTLLRDYEEYKYEDYFKEY